MGNLKSLPFRYQPVAQASEPAFPGKGSLACAVGLVFVQLQNLRVGLVFVQLQKLRVDPMYIRNFDRQVWCQRWRPYA